MTKHKQLGAWLHKNGVTFRVWAPFADSVAVSGSFNDWQLTDMVRDDSGIWSVDIEGAQAGQEYRYLIHNGEQQLFKNDPRALQINTSAGNSIIADREFEWTDENFTPKPFNEQVIYELHVGTFSRPDPATTGTFEDVQAKLDYLADLGVTTIELMPISSMSLVREWWGYTPGYLYAVETIYGGRRKFLEFVNAAHARGIAVILDVVYNHLGPGPLDIWQFDGWSENGQGGIYFYNDWRSQTPWGDTRLDYGRSEVRDFILDNITMWLADSHLDGLRVDSTIFIRNVHGNNDDPDHDLPDGWRLLQDINDRAQKIKPGILTIAEDVGGNPYITEAIGLGGAGFGSQWETGFPHALRAVLQPSEDVYRDMGPISFELSRSYNNDAFRRVVYCDSHDTAANGAARLAEQISPGNATNVYARKRNLLASVVTLTTPGIPMLLQGQEFNEGGAFSDWQELDWEKANKFKGIVEAHKQLIALRRNLSNKSRGLSGQNVKIIHTDNDNKVLAWHRWMDGGPGDDVIVIANFSNNVLDNYQLGFPRQGTWHVRFNSSWQGYSQDFKEVDIDSLEATETGAVRLAPYSAIILSQD